MKKILGVFVLAGAMMSCASRHEDCKIVRCDGADEGHYPATKTEYDFRNSRIITTEINPYSAEAKVISVQEMDDVTTREGMVELYKARQEHKLMHNN